MTDYVAELKLLASDCEFDAFLEQVLRDVFAMGVADRETQRKMREVKNLTFAKAVELALARESLSREIADSTNEQNAAGVHALTHSRSRRQWTQGRRSDSSRQDTGRGVQGQSSSGRSQGQHVKKKSTGARKCHRCGKNHDASSCKYREYECHLCHRRGHLRSMCRSKVKFLESQSGEKEFPDTSCSEEEEEEDTCHSIQISSLLF